VFFGSEVPSLGRDGKTGPVDIAEEGDGQCDDALHDEQPAPASASVDSVKILECGCLQVSGEHGAEGVAHEPDAGALEEFFVFEP
jgi:hypothetical protein